MIIHKISIENFQSYYDCQSLDFSEGLNLIIGNGGKGKSKLFNAFYWSLFGKIYITDIGWVDTDVLSLSSKSNMGKHEFINKRALSLAKKNDYVRASVLIELTNFENGRNIDYVIERFVVGKKINEDSWETESAWHIVPNELKVSYETNTGTRIEEGNIAELKIEDLFPTGIRNYIWFQGESLDSLIDFRKKETLKAAVKHISYYPLYEKLSQIISISTEKITSQERRKTAAQNKNNEGVQKLIRTIENNKIHLEKARANRIDLENQIIELSSIMQKDEKKLEGLADFTGIVKEYDKCELDMSNINGQLDKLDEYQRRDLPQVWIMRGINSMIEESKQIIHSHTSQQDTLPEKKYLDNPGRAKLEEIIEKKLCYICGSDVMPETKAFNTIIKRIKEQEEYFKELEEYTSNLSFNKKFERFIGSISDFPDNILVSLNAIDRNFEKSENEIEKLLQNRKILIERKKILDDKIADIKNKFHIDPQKQAGSASIISSGLKATRGNIERLNRKLEIEKGSISSYESENRKCEKELEKFNSSSPCSSRWIFRQY